LSRISDHAHPSGLIAIGLRPFGLSPAQARTMLLRQKLGKRNSLGPARDSMTNPQRFREWHQDCCNAKTNFMSHFPLTRHQPRERRPDFRANGCWEPRTSGNRLGALCPHRKFEFEPNASRVARELGSVPGRRRVRLPSFILYLARSVRAGLRLARLGRRRTPWLTELGSFMREEPRIG